MWQYKIRTKKCLLNVWLKLTMAHIDEVIKIVLMAIEILGITVSFMTTKNKTWKFTKLFQIWIY